MCTIEESQTRGPKKMYPEVTISSWNGYFVVCDFNYISKFSVTSMHTLHNKKRFITKHTGHSFDLTELCMGLNLADL